MRLAGTSLWFGAIGLAMVAGCGSEFTTTDPSTTGTGGTSSTTTGTSTGTSSGGGGSSTTGTGGSSTTGTGGMMTGTGGATTTTTTTGTGGAGGVMTECNADADCVTKYGPSQCGGRACVGGACVLTSPGCVDADHDGFGAGQGCMCAAIDCDDADPAVKDTKSCYTGPANTAGVGVCRAGTITCLPGGPSACVGQIVPSGEACNGEDDDCNGNIDDKLGKLVCGVGACTTSIAACQNGALQACIPLVAPNPPPADGCDGIDNDCDGAIDEDCNPCVYVTKLGVDMGADGTLLKPFGTIQAAITFAAMNLQNNAARVCVTAGALCGATGNYAGSFTMAEGVSVLANYESTLGTRCSANSNTSTGIQVKTPEGVVFPSSIGKPTVLDGFRIDRAPSAINRGVTVDGAKGAMISNVSIPQSAAGVMVTHTYGVVVQNGGDAIIGPKNRIEAGGGSVEAIGVRAQASKVIIQDNCQTYDNKGRCNDFCGQNPSIRGGNVAATQDSYGVLLVDSPNALIETSAICGNAGVHGAAVKITGDSNGTVVRANKINAFGGTSDSHGVWMEDCNNGKPWIVDNTAIVAQGANAGTAVDGVRAVGQCHAVIDANTSIGGGGEGQSSKPNGVHCLAKGGHPSGCIIATNALVYGSSNGFPPEATGVRCEGGSCVRIVRNALLDGRGGQVAYGVFLQGTGTFVDANLIAGGCAPTATGLEADDSFARIQNNLIVGYNPNDCQGGMIAPIETRGMRVVTQAGPNEIDVHSNDIDGSGSPQAQCKSYGIKLESGAQPAVGGSGIFRNNILNPGVCFSARYNFAEATASADPRIFQNNDLNPAVVAPSALYLDEGVNGLMMLAQINGLMGTLASNNLSVDPAFVAYPNNFDLQPNSPCKGMGTPTGAPGKDIGGVARPSPPAIGAYEP